jgi:ABC-2 type transport system ATP-binding protein
VAPVIEARELTRTYRTTTGVLRRKPLHVEAVRGISFEVGEGELFGPLAPHGAGKTTTIKMLITLLLPTSGEARVLGLDVVRDAREVRKRIGYVFGGDRGLYERLSGLDNLRYFAELYGVTGRRQRERIDEVLDLVGLHIRERERGRATRVACASGSTSRVGSSTTRRAASRGRSCARRSGPR